MRVVAYVRQEVELDIDDKFYDLIGTKNQELEDELVDLLYDKYPRIVSIIEVADMDTDGVLLNDYN